MRLPSSLSAIIFLLACLLLIFFVPPLYEDYEAGFALALNVQNSDTAFTDMIYYHFVNSRIVLLLSEWFGRSAYGIFMLTLSFALLLIMLRVKKSYQVISYLLFGAIAMDLLLLQQFTKLNLLGVYLIPLAIASHDKRDYYKIFLWLILPLFVFIRVEISPVALFAAFALLLYGRKWESAVRLTIFVAFVYLVFIGYYLLFHWNDVVFLANYILYIDVKYYNISAVQLQEGCPGALLKAIRYFILLPEGLGAVSEAVPVKEGATFFSRVAHIEEEFRKVIQSPGNLFLLISVLLAAVLTFFADKKFRNVNILVLLLILFVLFFVKMEDHFLSGMLMIMELNVLLGLRHLADLKKEKKWLLLSAIVLLATAHLSSVALKYKERTHFNENGKKMETMIRNSGAEYVYVQGPGSSYISRNLIFEKADFEGKYLFYEGIFPSFSHFKSHFQRQYNIENYNDLLLFLKKNNALILTDRARAQTIADLSEECYSLKLNYHPLYELRLSEDRKNDIVLARIE